MTTIIYPSSKKPSRHDCLFTGGPRDGEIHEVDDSTMVVYVNEVNLLYGGEPDAYDRVTSALFTFRVPTIEPAKEETWRDRSIKDPIFW